MKNSRILVLNLYVPIVGAIYLAAMRSLPTIDIDTFKTFIIYVICATPIYFVAHLATHLSYLYLTKHRAIPQFALLIGGFAAVFFACFFLRVIYEIIWQWLPWLAGGFTYDYDENPTGFWSYFYSSSGLLFTPTWFLANAAYEYVSGDRVYFPEKTNSPKTVSTAYPVSADQQRPVEHTGLLSKVARNLHGKIVAIEAQQHYVRIHTDIGNEMVLYRFGDAVHEFETQGSGLQVHRSFLIIPQAVVETRRNGRSLYLLMRNGLQVPVSQSYRGLVARFPSQTEINPSPIGATPSAHS